MSNTIVTTTTEISCRLGCGACCIAPSISSAIPDMPNGKPAGVRCVQLSSDNLCLIFGHPARPAVCASLRANIEMCGDHADAAMLYLNNLEKLTATTPTTSTDSKSPAAHQ